MQHAWRSLLLFAATISAGSAASAQESPTESAAQSSFDIDAIDVSGNTILPQDAIERAVYPHLGPGKSAADVEAARAALEKAYHDRGYQSVFVQIPEQSTDSRVFLLAVTEARVARLNVTGVGSNGAVGLLAAVPALKSGAVPNLAQVEREITAANRIPERQIIPTVEPGEEPGTINVELAVERKSGWHGSQQFTNDHNDGTRPLRVMATIRHSNLWGAGHQLTATALTAPQNVDNLQVFSGSYLAPLSSSFSLLAFGYKSNTNIAALGGTNVLGNGYQAGARGVLNLPSKNPKLFHSVNFGFDYKNFKEEIALPDLDETVLTPIDYVTFVGSYQLGIITDISQLNASVSVTAGVPGIGRQTYEGIPVFGNKGGLFNADANFVHLNIDADYTRSFKDDMVVALRGATQFATGPLVSNEQFASGGMLSVRGYNQSEAVGDWGLNGSFELRTPSLARRLGNWMDEWRFFGFVDGAYIRVMNPGEGVKPSYRLLSAGLGTRIKLFGILSGDAALGWPLKPTDKSEGPIVTFSIKTEY